MTLREVLDTGLKLGVRNDSSQNGVTLHTAGVRYRIQLRPSAMLDVTRLTRRFNLVRSVVEGRCMALLARLN